MWTVTFVASLAFILIRTSALPAATYVPCTTGSPVVSYGYMIKYAEATPTAMEKFQGAGYQPEPTWASSQIAGTHTFGVPSPVESGFAYAQFKCQFACNSYLSGSFFVKYPYVSLANDTCSFCTCYKELLDPETFVPCDDTVVGAWNRICK